MVHKNDSTLTKNYAEILNIQYSFYKELYTKDDWIRFGLVNTTRKVLDDATRGKFEQMISADECFDAVMTLKSGKTPGSDGLGVLVYRKFWKTLIGPLHEMYVEAVRSGYLNFTGRRGIIKLIPKKGKDDLLVQNWRPITLLNYNYKIWVKALAN